jgi:hypothetical protein
VQIFGRTMVCRNLDVAQVVSRSSNLDCVTMEVRYCIHD